jgi:phosphonate transport system substrate-binding protein
MPVELEIPADYRETARRLSQGEWDLALLGPVLYSRAHEQGYAALAMPVRGGTSVFSGVIVTRQGSPIATIADLRGKRIAFVDASSSAGFQYPIAHLFANGLSPSDFERVFVGGHRAVARQVLEGKLDAGACYEGAIAEELSAEEQAGLRILARTEPVPGDVIAARASSPHFETLRRALSSLQGDEAARVLGPLHAEGLAAPDERLFDSARRVDLLVSEEAGL